MIDEFIILNKQGIPLFAYDFLRSRYKQEDYHLIGCFLDQLVRFTKASMQKDLNAIEWDKYSLFFYTEKETQIQIIIKCETNKIVNINYTQKSLNLIAYQILNKFKARYGDYLSNFNGNISQFRTFSEDIEKMFRIK